METHSGEAPILVLGGTGHLGREIVGGLLKRGEPVRVLSRNAANAHRVLGDGPAIVEGDITSRESVVEALQGTRGVVIAVAAFTPKLIRKLKLIEGDSVLAVLEEAQRLGVPRVVYISVYDIRQDLLDELSLQMESAGIKLEVERALAESNLNWTVLGAPPSMQIFFSFIRGTRMMVPGGGPPALPTVSRLDVAEIAAEAVLRDDLAGRRIQMVGPEAMSFREAARRISAVVGKEIRYQKIPLLPLRVASIVTKPFNPFLWHVVGMLKLMSHFPSDVVEEVPRLHQLLLDTFDYVPTTLEMEARRWVEGSQ